MLLSDLNRSFAEPVVALSTGGKDGGGAELTAFGASLIKRYRALEKAVDELAARQFAGVRAAGDGGKATGTQARRALKLRLAGGSR